MADENNTLYITARENPDIVFLFYNGDGDENSTPPVPRLDLTGATITVTSNIPDLPLVYSGDQTQGIVVVSIPLLVGAALKKFTEYWIAVSAIDADSKNHVAQVFVSVT